MTVSACDACKCSSSRTAAPTEPGLFSHSLHSRKGTDRPWRARGQKQDQGRYSQVTSVDWPCSDYLQLTERQSPLELTPGPVLFTVIISFFLKAAQSSCRSIHCRIFLSSKETVLDEEPWQSGTACRVHKIRLTGLISFTSQRFFVSINYHILNYHGNMRSFFQF